MKVSAVVLTKNAQNTITECIKSLSFCDEVVVVDDFSTDDTIQVIKKIKNISTKILKHDLQEDFSQQRNFALDHVKNEWVLFVDADEVVTDSLAKEILGLQDSDIENVQGYTIQRRDTMWGQELLYGEAGNNRFVRLARKNAGKWVGTVHETWKISGNIQELNNLLYHYPHPTISEFLKEINTYSTLRAQELYTKKVKSNLFFILMYPGLKFIKNYIWNAGYKDKTAGFICATIMSLHSFLVRAKLYLLWKGIKNT